MLQFLIHLLLAIWYTGGLARQFRANLCECKWRNFSLLSSVRIEFADKILRDVGFLLSSARQMNARTQGVWLVECCDHRHYHKL